MKVITSQVRSVVGLAVTLRTAVSRLVIAVLEERGLAARAPRPADKRQVALTAAGRSLVEQVRQS